MALNPLLYGHIVPWNAQFLDVNGQPLANGHIEIFIAGTSEKYISYQNFDGNVNPFKVSLTAGGQCVAIGINTNRYDIYVYDRFGSLAYSRLNIGVSDSEGVNLTFTSSDGSIIIVRDGNNVDLTVRQDENTYGTITGTTTDQNGAIVFSNVEDGNISVTNSGRLVVEKGKLYHISLAMKFATTDLHNQYASCIVTDSEGGHHDFVLDESIPENYTEVSWDMIPQSAYVQLALQMPSYFSLEKATVYVHRVNPLAGGGGGSGGSNVDIVSEDHSVTITEHTASDTKVYDLHVDVHTFGFIDIEE